MENELENSPDYEWVRENIVGDWGGRTVLCGIISRGDRHQPALSAGLHGFHKSLTTSSHHSDSRMHTLLHQQLNRSFIVISHLPLQSFYGISL